MPYGNDVCVGATETTQHRTTADTAELLYCRQAAGNDAVANLTMTASCVPFANVTSSPT
ncbi:MAG: hypothetical protein WDM89_02265 [Rhizomicrobium sp.]